MAHIALADWSCCERPPNSIAHPDQLTLGDLEWLPAKAPGTVASALRDAGRWNIDQPLDADARDWWYRSTFPMPENANEGCRLCFDGLATLAEIWLNGAKILTTDNMFRAYRVEIGPLLLKQNELVVAFRSLSHDLEQKRPRPRWKTKLVNHQQLRWRRTTLLGRMPGWSPVTPVGPWRAVQLETGPCLSDCRLTSTTKGSAGLVHFSA